MAEPEWENDKLEEDDTEERSKMLSPSELGQEDDEEDEFSTDEDEDLENTKLDELDY